MLSIGLQGYYTDVRHASSLYIFDSDAFGLLNGAPPLNTFSSGLINLLPISMNAYGSDLVGMERVPV